MRISVLIATYNGSRFISELMSSLIQQEDAPDEIVVCDDCSIDDTVKIIENFNKKTTIPIIIHINKKNKGYRKNFFDGLEKCSGDYVAFCDQDDVWLANKIGVMRKKILENDYPGMLFSDCLIVDEHLNPRNMGGLEYSGISTKDYPTIQKGNLIKILVEKPCITGMTMVCKLKDISRNFPLSSSLPHDYLVSTGFAANSDYFFINEPLVLYRQHASNIIGMQNSGTKRKRRRPKIYSKKYPEALNKDLQDKIELLTYADQFKKTLNAKQGWSDLIKEALIFYQFRLSRRLSFRGFMKEEPSPLKLEFNEEKLRWMLMKDIRCYIRLKFHYFLECLKLTKTE